MQSARPPPPTTARSRAANTCATPSAKPTGSAAEVFIGLLEWLSALGNAEGMAEWIADSAAARILA